MSGAHKVVDSERRRLAALPEGQPILFDISEAPDARRARVLGIEATGQGVDKTGRHVIVFIRTAQESPHAR